MQNYPVHGQILTNAHWKLRGLRLCSSVKVSSSRTFLMRENWQKLTREKNTGQHGFLKELKRHFRRCSSIKLASHKKNKNKIKLASHRAVLIRDFRLNCYINNLFYYGKGWHGDCKWYNVRWLGCTLFLHFFLSNGAAFCEQAAPGTVTSETCISSPPHLKNVPVKIK